VTPIPPDSHAKLRQALTSREQTDALTGACLADDVVAGLAEGSLEASARAAALLHLVGCLHCRRAVASVARAIGDGAVAREAARVEGTRRHNRWYWVPASAAAAAAVLFLMVQQGRVHDPPETDLHRAPTIANGSAPRTISPAGLVATAAELRWGAVAGADRYRVTLYDASGRVVYEIEPVDTAAALPDSLRLQAGKRYLWKVDARTGFDRWVSSNLVEFSIAGGPDR